LNKVWVDNGKIHFKKSFSPHEIETAECLGFSQVEDVITVDPRLTFKKSLFEWMKYAFPTLMLTPSEEANRQYLFAQLKAIYDHNQQDFVNNFFSQAQYEQDLYGHQIDALSVMAHRKYNLLSFEQGLGKTITSATLSKIFGIRRTIVICPALVKWNWYHELSEKWGYDMLKFTVLDRNRRKMITAFEEWWVIVNYEMIDKFFSHLIRDDVRHIIIDECQYIKNAKTKRYAGVEKLVTAFPNARITLLSGTPITNRVNDLFAYMKLTGHKLGENNAKFMRTYTTSTSGRGGARVTGAKNIEELRFRISNFMIRKKTDECIDLPDLIINKYHFENEDFEKEYNEVLEQLMRSKDNYDDTLDPQQKAQIKTKMKASLHTLNRIIAIAKVKGITGLIDQLNDMGRKVVVFSSYTDPLNRMLEHYGTKAVKIDGSINAYDRDQYIQKFISDPNTMVFLGNVKAAGVGINLVNSHDVIFTNFPFTPDDLEQPYKRLHRIGQATAVNVYYTICKDTIDEYIYDMITDKTLDINALIDDGKTGVVDYETIPNRLFSALVNDYKRKKGLPVTEVKDFEPVK